jgi:hypothetical protein
MRILQTYLINKISKIIMSRIVKGKGRIKLNISNIRISDKQIIIKLTNINEMLINNAFDFYFIA